MNANIKYTTLDIIIHKSLRCVLIQIAEPFVHDGVINHPIKFVITHKRSVAILTKALRISKITLSSHSAKA